MLDFPRWKVWLVWATIAFCALLAIPSFVPEESRAKWPGWVPQPVINLGLDLAGGSYILLEADTRDVAVSRLETMREQITAEMRRGNPRIAIGDISTRGEQLSFMVRDASQVDAARERLLPMTTGAALTGQRDWDISVVDTSRFVVRQTTAGLNAAIDTAMNDAREIVGKRINALGTREPTIVRQGNNRIVVEVPGLQNPQALKELLGKTAKLEFKLVDEVATQAAQTGAPAPVGTQVLPYAEGGGGLIAVKRSIIVSGDQLIDSTQGFHPQNGSPIVNFTFDGAGGRRFARVTQESTGQRFAIIVDNTVISAPMINTPILGGAGYIEGSFTAQSANELAIALRSGKLPVALEVVQESTVSAELGADSIQKGVLAGIVGSLALIFFMILTYVRFGVYTTAALLVNAVMIMGVMALFNATLTLPGIAGFVLTIGAAVDANVLINERIREEARKGRNIISTVEVGYKEASRAIFDANITNVISATIMFIFGSGPIRGFAVVLAIGIVTSVFTGVTFTRLLVAGWLKRNRPKAINI